MNYLWIFLGGGAGACLRYLVSRFFPLSGNVFPWGTFLANVLSCILLGFLIAYSAERPLENKYQLLLMTGLCGGFSTFSTFSAEIYRMISFNNWFMITVYIGTSLLFCVLSIFLGIKLFGN